MEAGAPQKVTRRSTIPGLHWVAAVPVAVAFHAGLLWIIHDQQQLPTLPSANELAIVLVPAASTEFAKPTTNPGQNPNVPTTTRVPDHAADRTALDEPPTEIVTQTIEVAQTREPTTEEPSANALTTQPLPVVEQPEPAPAEVPRTPTATPTAYTRTATPELADRRPAPANPRPAEIAVTKTVVAAPVPPVPAQLAKTMAMVEAVVEPLQSASPGDAKRVSENESDSIEHLAEDDELDDADEPANEESVVTNDSIEVVDPSPQTLSVADSEHAESVTTPAHDERADAPTSVATTVSTASLATSSIVPVETQPTTATLADGRNLAVASSSESSASQDVTVPAEPLRVASVASQVNLNAIRNSHEAQILALINANTRYPLRARQRGDEGVAKVVFTIDRSGNVVDSKLVSSSGHRILDRESLARIKRVPAFPPIPVELAITQLTVTVPMRFNLN